MSDLVVGEGDLKVTVRPQVGGTITSVRHEGLGVQVLGRVPWEVVAEPLPGGAARDEPEWLTRFTGGWPLMFPSGGDAGAVGGTFHGFHGEGSITPWDARPVPGGVVLSRRFSAVPVTMQREVRVAGDALTVAETAVADEDVEVMWGQHVTFGSDLLDGRFAVEAGARRVKMDDRHDPPGNPLRPGAAGAWPLAPGKAGPVDLSRPQEGMGFLAYLTDWAAPFVAIRRADGVRAEVFWEGGVYDAVWYWCELGSAADAPWDGRARLIGLEPCSTPRAHGLADARARGERLVALRAGEPVSATTRLRVGRS